MIAGDNDKDKDENENEDEDEDEDEDGVLGRLMELEGTSLVLCMIEGTLSSKQD